LKSVYTITGGLLASASCVLADTAILVALPVEQSALSREVRVVGQSVELAQHRVSVGYHFDGRERSAGRAGQVRRWSGERVAFAGAGGFGRYGAMSTRTTFDT